MTLGKELRRAYVNDLAVLQDGTLVSVHDDGHVQLWRHGALAKDVRVQRGPMDLALALPSLDRGPAFATAGEGCVRLWADQGSAYGGGSGVALPSPRGTTPGSLVAATAADGRTLLLAAAHRVTYRPDPNRFRLVPQDEAGQRRRARAEEEERNLIRSLSRAAACVRLWMWDPSSRAPPRQALVEPVESAGDPAAVVTALANFAYPQQNGGMIVIGDSLGGLRLVRALTNSAGRLEEFATVKRVYLNPTREGGTSSVVCMKPLGDGLLAVSTRPGSTTLGNSFAGEYTAIDVPHAEAVHVIDLHNSALVSVLKGHRDTVMSMCVLPGGGLATSGGKMDAQTLLWSREQLEGAVSEHQGEIPIRTESDTALDEGYIFAATVLPDSKPASDHYALAVARYNVVKIYI